MCSLRIIIFIGVRALDGSMTDLLERDAFAAKHSINDIYSCSWGPEDDGKTVDGPHTLAKVRFTWLLVWVKIIIKIQKKLLSQWNKPHTAPTHSLVQVIRYTAPSLFFIFLCYFKLYISLWALIYS